MLQPSTTGYKQRIQSSTHRLYMFAFYFMFTHTYGWRTYSSRLLTSPHFICTMGSYDQWWTSCSREAIWFSSSSLSIVRPRFLRNLAHKSNKLTIWNITLSWKPTILPVDQRSYVVIAHASSARYSANSTKTFLLSPDPVSKSPWQPRFHLHWLPH